MRATSARDSRAWVNHAVNKGASLLPDRLFGCDTDEVLSYSTSKVVWIRNRFIGSCYYFMITMIVLWVLGGQILVRNEHFLRKDVTGLARLWYSHPTVDSCDPIVPSCEADFKPRTLLPYCTGYEGTAPEVQQADCKYLDRLTLIPHGVTDNKIFIPTAIEIVTEARKESVDSDDKLALPDEHTGEYAALKGRRCLRGDFLCQERGGKRHQFYYVADAKSFVIRFTSSFERDNIRGNSLQLPAFVGVCDSLLRTGNESRTWTERREAQTQNRCEGDYRNEPLSCGKGVSCAEMRDFDFLEDSGLNVMGRGVASRVKDVTGRIVNASRGNDRGETADFGAGSDRRAAQMHKPGEAVHAVFAVLKDSDDSSADGSSALLSAHRRSLRSGRQGSSRTHHRLHAPPTTAKEDRTEAPKMQQYSDNWGDVFTLGRLLQLAGADLDLDHNMDGWTTRQAGTSIEVLAVYNNLYPLLSTFGYKPVQYHYVVKEMLLPYVSRSTLSPVQPPDYPQSRTYENRYGVLIHFQVSGSFGFFNPVYLVLMLTAAFALTATASTVTDMFFLYLSDQRDNFFHLKYDVSPDFSDMWRCEVCGFFNLQAHDVCQGVPKFSCPSTTPKCGAERPKT